MFFPERIKSIKDSDRVLEVGPGSNPHHRSDILLEKKFECEVESKNQRSGGEELPTSNRLVFYDGGVFPFNDNEFDYVICSHVLEHVPDVDAFLNEIVRVGKGGYLEYPTILYDYMFDIPEHVNFLKWDGKESIKWMKKDKTHLREFKSVTNLFFDGMNKRHTGIIKDYKNYMFEGFEWTGNILSEETDQIESLVVSTEKLIDKKRLKNNLSYYLKKVFK